MTARLLGLRTTNYKVTDLATAKAWYSKVFGITPYFDEPFYVGYNVGGFELGLDPDVSSTRPGIGGTTTYWGVEDIEATFEGFASDKVEVHSAIQEVGDGIKLGSVRDPFGNIVGIIENPLFGKE